MYGPAVMINFIVLACFSVEWCLVFFFLIIIYLYELDPLVHAVASAVNSTGSCMLEGVNRSLMSD